MKIRYLVTLVFCAATTAAPVMAADGFSGFYISGGLGQKSSNVEEGVANGAASGSIKLGETSFSGQLAGGYNFALDGGFQIGLGAFYDIGDGKAGGATATVANLSATYAVKETRRYGISLEPGYALTKDTVAYVKLMYNWINSEETLTGATTGYGSASFRAFGYGLGLKSMVTNKIYAFAEWQQAQYGSATFSSGVATLTYKPNETLGLVGVGVNF